MFIDIEFTPNPETLKFVPEQVLLERGTANFTQADEAANSPLGTALFAIDGVEGVFISYDFLSVTKRADLDWEALRPSILETLQTFFASGQPIMDKAAGSETAVAMDDDPADAEIVAQIQTLLDDKIRPAVAGDGGDIVYRGFKEGTVFLQMQGACAGCPSSTMTLKHGIENLLKYYVPEVSGVEAV